MAERTQQSQPSDLESAYQAWSTAADAVLAKSRRVDVADLPDTAESLLSTQTADGLTIRPLYTRRDEVAEPGTPGSHPFVRGADPVRDVVMGWRVTDRFGDDPDISTEDLNRDVLDAMGAGASGLWLRVGSSIRADNLAAVLAGVYLDLIPVTLDAGPDGIAAARALLSARETAQSAPQAATPTIATMTSLGFSPLTAAFAERPDVDAAEATAVAVELARPGVRAFRVDGTDFATAGADNGLELALLTAAGVAHLRDLSAAGLSPAQALAQLSFAVAVDDDQFASIAKLRALRQIWARVAEVLGAPEAGGALTHAVTDLSMYSQRDPWVNMLRSTIAAFGGGVGGADQVTVLGFDAAIPADQRTSGASFSRRIARNTQLLLLEESNIGRVLDPSGGSWFVESLTTDMAANGWAVFADIEARGGYRAALESGWIAERVAESLATRDVEVAHRRIAVTGVNEFPNLDEKPFGQGKNASTASTTDVATATPRLARVGRAFESLRDRSDEQLRTSGSRPSVLLLPLGSVAEHNGRTTFTSNLLAAGGITAINPGPITADGVAAAVAAASTSIAVICGTARRYADDGPALLAAARAAGLNTVLLAGPAKEWPSSHSEDNHGEPSSDQPDGSLRVGIDAVAMLTALADQLATTSAGKNSSDTSATPSGAHA